MNVFYTIRKLWRLLTITVLKTSEVVVLNIPLAEKCRNTFRRKKLKIVTAVSVVDTLEGITFGFNKCDSLFATHDVFGFNEHGLQCWLYYRGTLEVTNFYSFVFSPSR